jgi:hypothetical protein
VAEVFVEFPEVVQAEDGRSYLARACGAPTSTGLWQGWLEFVPIGRNGIVVRSRRETTQPNRQNIDYWATGLTPIYLEGALHRALLPPRVRVLTPELTPSYDGPAPHFAEPDLPAARAHDSILNPFSVYRKGELILRGQLAALSAWHLVNIVKAYGLVNRGVDPARFSQPELIEMIVSAVKRREWQPISKPREGQRVSATDMSAMRRAMAAR